MKPKENLELLTEQERQVIQSFVKRLQHRFDGELVSALLFGSRARGEAMPNSDMDVLVVLVDTPPGIRKEIRHLAAEVWLEYDIFLSTRVWSQAHWHRLEKLQTGFFRSIQHDGIGLLESLPQVL